MDILQPTLPVEGIHVYGVNRSGYGQTETENKEPKPKALERIEVLDELILHKSGCFERGRRWLRGQHPKLGVIAWGYTGWETMQDFDRIRPIGTFTVSRRQPPDMSQNPHDASRTHKSENPLQQSSDDEDQE